MNCSNGDKISYMVPLCFMYSSHFKFRTDTCKCKPLQLQDSLNCRYPPQQIIILFEFPTADKYGIITEDTKVENKHDLSHGSRTQRGKGAYGGQDVNHNSATSFLPCISTLSVALPLMRVLPFYLL
ncbi:hypothetical protein HKD37_15G041413 [Glycine soja]